MTAAGFLKRLRTEKIGNFRWILTDDLPFRSVKFPGVFIAPAGFQTDLASIPRIAWTIFPKAGGKHDPASVVHDAGYAHALVTENGDRIHTVKAVADLLFLEGMQAEHVSGFGSRLMYAAVSAFGNPAKHPLAANRLGSLHPSWVPLAKFPPGW